MSELELLIGEKKYAKLLECLFDRKNYRFIVDIFKTHVMLFDNTIGEERFHTYQGLNNRHIGIIKDFGKIVL